MDLRAFITQSLLDIVNGVSDAQQQCAKGVIVPKTTSFTEAVKTGYTPYQIVEMNIQVRVEDTQEKSGKISVLGGTDATHTGQETSLAFRVPIKFKTNDA